MNASVTVHKLDHLGREVWRYPGRLLERQANLWKLEAIYGRGEGDMAGLYLRPGDRFVETFYADRGYNVFEVHDADSDVLKGWYCNLARPARLEAHDVYQEDLALDLVVLPDRSMHVLDEDEYEALGLAPAERLSVEAALAELKALAAAGRPPFELD
jgi:uncharacterized protein